MTGPDQPGSYHRSPCNRCGVEGFVGFDRTRIEQRPWRMVWVCEVCEATAVRAVPRHLGPSLVLMMDYPGGSVISRREVRELERVDLELFDELVRDEILASS